jgi:hypothetical protein
VLCAVTIPPADLRSLSLYYYTVCGRMCMSSVCLVFLSVGDLPVNCFVMCVGTHITKQFTGRSSIDKKTETCKGFYTYKHVFNILLVLNVEVSVF